MESYLNPPREQWPALCRRPASANPAVRARVETILQRVREQGDEALRALSLEIDGRPLDAIEVSAEEIREASAQVSDAVRRAVAQAEDNIHDFHAAQRPKEISVETAPGVRCIQRPVPIEKVGLYIPGGTAPLFSTVLMLAVPASIAGCPEVVLCTPAGKDGKVNAEVLYTAAYCGVKRIFKLGGAQAVAAMAYGTRTVPKVDKIFGPGNQYVTTAKQLLSADTVAIDMPAGPSEVMVLADDAAEPAFVAADLLSQAEHGADSQVMLLCRSRAFAARVEEALAAQTAALGRKGNIASSLSESRILVFDGLRDMTDFANAYAPEHLIVATEDPWRVCESITAAGSVFVGPWSPESAGDYASGTNHTLPTAGWARSCSGVSMDSFFRKMTLQSLSREGLEGLGRTIITLAEAESLQAHANAVSIRLEHGKEQA
jgi:histidinol dehydrogenase